MQSQCPARHFTKMELCKLPCVGSHKPQYSKQHRKQYLQNRKKIHNAIIFTNPYNNNGCVQHARSKNKLIVDRCYGNATTRRASERACQRIRRKIKRSDAMNGLQQYAASMRERQMHDAKQHRASSTRKIKRYDAMIA